MFAKVYPRISRKAMGKGRHDVRVVLRAMFSVRVMFGLALPVSAETKLPADTELVTIMRVVDGDTIKLQFEDGTVDTVRLIGIGTPRDRGSGKSGAVLWPGGVGKNKPIPLQGS